MPGKPTPYLCALVITLFTSCALAQPSGQGKHPLAGQKIALPSPLAVGQVDLPRLPSISPDGASVCFSWRGDLWRVPRVGGQATRLTAHPMDDGASAWSPDGETIAFNSTRSGFRNVYRMNADGSGVAAVTREDRPHLLSGWSGDGAITLTGWREADVHASPRPYRVAPSGGEVTRLHDAFGRSPAASPDGRYVAFVRGGARWSQPFNTNPNNRDIWLYDQKDRSFRQLTENPGTDGMPRWLDNETLVYLSARPPARVNLYRLNIHSPEAEAQALTAFEDDDVQHFDLARDSGSAVLHVWDRLYSLEARGVPQRPRPIAITAPMDTGDRVIVKPLQGRADHAALSPDGKVMAVSIHGELFVRTLDSKDPAQRVTRHAALDHQPAWSPDGQTLYFTSDRDGTLSIYRARVALTRRDIEAALSRDIPGEGGGEAEQATVEPSESGQALPGRGPVTADGEGVAAAQAGPAEAVDQRKAGRDEPANSWHDAVRFELAPVVQAASHDSDPSPSPDGKTLAFRRGNGALVLLDLQRGHERVFVDQWDRGLHWAWSGDSRTLAVCYEDQDHNADIWVGPADGSTPPINITKHPAADRAPSFSSDGKVLTFVSSRVDGQYDVYAVYLDRALETRTPQQLDDYYKQASERVKQHQPLPAVQGKPASPEDGGAGREGAAGDAYEPGTPLDLEDAYLRLRRLTDTPDNERQAIVHPDGGRVLFTRDGTLFAIGWDAKQEKKIADSFDLRQLSMDGSAAVGLSKQEGVKAPLDGGEPQTAAVEGGLRVDRRAMHRQRFVEASRALAMTFYDGSFKGIDWSGATAKYGRLASRAWTPSEFDDVANRYLGLLNASHMRIRSPEQEAANRQPNGRLGASYKQRPQGYEVVAIQPDTPAAQGPMRLEIGDIITAIDFVPLEPADTIAARLAGRVGRETAVTVLRQRQGGDGPQPMHLLMSPISHRDYAAIRYDNWRAANQDRVEAWSGGRLGYIHIESMNASSLAEYERDLYAACEGKLGLVIDVRDNGGGWTTDRLLASIMTKRHAYTVPRGADPGRTNSYPISRLFIQRYNLPMNALCNENSFSNAEIFSHAFKTLGRGTLVGQTTAGGVISTGAARLVDGTTVRLPFRGWYLPDGSDMENNGAVPHLLIPQRPEHEAAGEDPQLRAAVDDLLKRL